VTILLYLNDWQPGDGGELRLFAPAKTPAATATALRSSGLLKAGEPAI
jgi:Rps23 Pro-64 3,4-dihydroxylase Tpa1-like proline 4-hydroxylase